MKRSFQIFFYFIIFNFLLFGISCSSQKKTGDDTIKSGDAEPEASIGWPRTVNIPEATLTFYQPQISDWEDYIYLKGWIAVEVVPKDKEIPPFYGSVNVKVQTETDFEERTVLLFNKEILEVKFDGSNPGIEKQVSDQIKVLQGSPEIISLDRLLPMLANLETEEEGITISKEAPPIYYSQKEAILVIVDGDPILAPIENTSLKFAVNTNWSLFFDTESNIYYLLNEDQWLKAYDIEEDWELVSQLPEAFSKLPNEENWTDVKEQIPAKSKKKNIPKVFVSEKPAELILLQGAPKYETIKEAKGLSLVANTESDLFLYGGTNSQYYILLSGRWFSAPSLEGPWTFATNDLPEAFTQIPENHKKGHVLAAIPNTQLAREAALQAKIPQVAEVSEDAEAPEVTYDGDPEFEEMDDFDDAEMSYAKNSEYDVIYVNNRYYLCYQGAWFVSPYPTYGWAIASTIPPPIYSIPAYYPCHHVSYVRIYGYGGGYVRFGYSAGYMGVYVAYGVPMYGTGYYYNPYYYYGPRYPYPIYRPYYYSYGCRARYNPYTGYYSRSARAYGPYGGVGRGAAYNPRTGTYARGRSAWGPGGYMKEGAAFNPRTGAGAYTKQGGNGYSSWGKSAVTKNGEWAKTGHYTDKNGTRYGYETSKGGKGVGFKGKKGNNVVAGKTKSGDIYAGKNGNIYKKDGDGWKSRDGNNWNNVSKTEKRPNTQQGKVTQDQKNKAKAKTQTAPKTRPSNTQPSRKPTQPRAQNNYQQQLNRDYNSRKRGNQRTQNYQNYQRSSGSNTRSRPSGQSRRKRG
jgi:hypothetical protein